MFDASNTRQCVQVPILPDDDLEDDEQFTVTLTSPPDESVVLDPDRGTITIVDTSGIHAHIVYILVLVRTYIDSLIIARWYLRFPDAVAS